MLLKLAADERWVFYKKEVPDSQHLTPPNKSQQQQAKDSWRLSIKTIRSCLGLSAAADFFFFFPWFLGSGGSPSVFLDQQIGFLLKQAAAVPFDNNVIIQNKWWGSLMRATLYEWRRLAFTPTSVWFYLLELYAPPTPLFPSHTGKFTGSDWRSVLKSD